MATGGRFCLQCFLLFLHSHVLVSSSFGDYPFRDVSLSWDKRVQDLIDRLTLEESIAWMTRGGALKNGPSPPIPRLGIKPYQWSTECLRGLVAAGNATSFPDSIGLAAAFSPELIYNVSHVTGIEARAKHNYHLHRGEYGDRTGISCFSPVINIARHPLWGRIQETYGEDPYLTGVYAAHFVRGLQGDHPRYVLANAGCKHFDVYAGPEDIPASRFSFNVEIAERDWRLTFLPAFKECVRAGSFGIMCSYNSINGVPACVNKKLLTDILRKEMGFKGYVISDAGALEFIISAHKYINNTVDTAAACVNAGVNIELSLGQSTGIVFTSLMQALQEGKISRQTILERLEPLINTRMRHGEFDPPSMNPYTTLNLSDVLTDAHRQLSLQAAMQSFVLMKNNHNMLPLKKRFQRLAIVGPMANDPLQIFGNYRPEPDPRFIITPLQGLKTMADEIFYASGCNGTPCSKLNSTNVRVAALDVDLIIVCLGTGQAVEEEGKDRANLDLPGQQLQLLKDVVDVAGDTPIILLIFSAGPLDISWAKESEQVTAIMECFFSAQATGNAVRQVLWNMGPYANPAGRLPMTWPASMSQVPDMINYTMEGRTYRYFEGEPLYPFGYGLSYTKFNYTNLKINPAVVKSGDNVTVTVSVKNVGQYDGDEVIEMYISWVNTTVRMPKYQLAGFTRVFIQQGQVVSHAFNITAEQMAVWVDGKGFMVEPGTIDVYVGGQQPNQNTTVPSNVLKGSFVIKS